MKKLFLVFCILFSIIFVHAEDLNITVEDIKVSEKSDTISVVEPSFNNNEVSSNITFNKIDDYVVLDITIKNNDENKYLIKKIEDNNKNENIDIDYSFSEDYIDVNETSDIKMTIKYNKKLINVESVKLSDLNISIIFDDGKVNINPGTGDNIVIYIIIAIISIIGIIVAFKYLKKGKKELIALIVLLPIVIFGKEVFTLNLVFKDIQVIGEFEVYDIKIDSDNGSEAQVLEIKYGDKLGNLEEPQKVGYTFSGWVDPDGNKVDENTVVTGELSVTAQYEINIYNIAYNLDGGSADNKESYTVEDEVTLTSPTKKGYAFKGWYSNSEFTGEEQTKIEKGNTGDKEYFAKWEIIDYTITYNLNDGVQGSGVVDEYNVNTDTFSLPLPTKENNNFKGWYEKEDFSDNANIKVEKGSTGNKVYYAKWDAYKSYNGLSVSAALKDGAVSDGIASLFVEKEDGVDFLKGSSITNGVGKYIVASTVNDTNPIYYYRGEVDDNNLIYAGFCWKIVRTTETGGTKLAYNGVPVNGKCTATGTDIYIGKNIKFNSSFNRAESIGYAYTGSHQLLYKNVTTVTAGTVFANDVTYENGKYILSSDKYTSDSEFKDKKDTDLQHYHYTCLNTASECTEVFYVFMTRDLIMFYVKLSGGQVIEDIVGNQNFDVNNFTSSTIKTYVENWYSNNLTSHTNELEDTVWCNDRSITNIGGWDKNTIPTDKIAFGSSTRISVTGKPSVLCPNNRDKFTVSTTNGNGVLTYPIGLLTADEATFSGFAWFDSSSSKSYLKDENLWWTMSPALVSANYSYIIVAYSMLDNVQTAFTTSTANMTSGCVKPSISLKPSIKIVSGTGSKEDPFTVNEN